MKPGDLVEFKAGLFGIKPPQNLAIWIERVKRKGNFFVVLHTVKGRQEVKPDSLSKRKLQARIDLPLPESELAERLKILIREVSEGKVEDQRTAAAKKGELGERELWLKTHKLEGPLTVAQMAEAFFDEFPAKKSSIEAVKSLMETTAQRGVGYFDRAEGRDRWQPIHHEEYGRAVRDIEGLNGLRKKLVRVEEEEDEETGDIRSFYVGVPLDDAGLDDVDRARLGNVVSAAMQEFVLHDRYLGGVGLGDTHIHAIDGFHLFTYLKWLALDWTGARGTSLSSAFVEFMVSTGLVPVDEAIRLVAKRKVLAVPDFDWEPDASAERAAERLPDPPPPEWMEGREDFRDIPCYTIDPPDARDHDDAVAFRREPDGGATLWVHIADVSRYVEQDTHLDHHARKRATSVYLPTGVLPMLPERISNDLCSLNEGVDRLCMTAIQRYDAEGTLVSERMAEGIIRVAKNISYGEVDEAVKQGAEPYASMEAFARQLRAKRRGLVLESQELKIHLTPDNVEHVIRQATPATEMIEVFMVSANEAVARFLTEHDAPCLYRCHPLPERWRVDRFNGQMKTLGIAGRVGIELPEPEDEGGDDEAEAGGGGSSFMDQLKAGGKFELFGGGGIAIKTDEPEPAAADDADDAAWAAQQEGEEGAAVPPPPPLKGLAQLSPEEQDAWLTPFSDALEEVDALKEPLRAVVYQKALGAMGRAMYTTDNVGHFGLGSTCYAHFTSPIRRYPDVTVHRQLRWLLQRQRGAIPEDAPMPHTKEALQDWGDHSSEQGANADDLERGTVAVALVFATRSGAWDGEQEGIVNGITKGGVFLTLPRGLEARMATSDLPGGPYAVDDFDSMLFVGEHERPNWQEEITEKNWRQFVATGPQGGKEAVLVRVRLADDLVVVIAGRDYVDGRVRVKLAGGEELEEETRQI